MVCFLKLFFYTGIIDLLFSIFSNVAINYTTLQVTEQEAVLAIRNGYVIIKTRKINANPPSNTSQRILID